MAMGARGEEPQRMFIQGVDGADGRRLSCRYVQYYKPVNQIFIITVPSLLRVTRDCDERDRSRASLNFGTVAVTRINVIFVYFAIIFDFLINHLTLDDF